VKVTSAHHVVVFAANQPGQEMDTVMTTTMFVDVRGTKVIVVEQTMSTFTVQNVCA
jgi:hypothetical protein